MSGMRVVMKQLSLGVIKAPGCRPDIMVDIMTCVITGQYTAILQVLFDNYSHVP